MNISSVSNNGHSINMNNNDSSIRLLEKQKAELQERIQKVSESKDDPKVKQEKIKEMQDQIREIESQIQMIQTEKMREKQNIEKKTDDDQVQGVTSNADGDTLTLSDMTSLLSSSNSYSRLKTINGIKTDLKGSERVLKSEIKLDEQRGVDTTVKRKELKEKEKGIGMLDEQIGKENVKVQNNIKRSEDDASKEDKKEDRETDEGNVDNEFYM